MRPDELYLRDMLAAAEAVGRFIEGVDEEGFLENEVLQSAVLQKVIVMGEAAARVSAAFRSSHPQVEWRVVTGMRNLVVHEYFAISWRAVWATARRDIPELADRIRGLIDAHGD